MRNPTCMNFQDNTVVRIPPLKLQVMQCAWPSRVVSFQRETLASFACLMKKCKTDGVRDHMATLILFVTPAPKMITFFVR